MKLVNDIGGVRVYLFEFCGSTFRMTDRTIRLLQSRLGLPQTLTIYRYDAWLLKEFHKSILRQIIMKYNSILYCSMIESSLDWMIEIGSLYWIGDCMILNRRYLNNSLIVDSKDSLVGNWIFDDHVILGEDYRYMLRKLDPEYKKENKIMKLNSVSYSDVIICCS